MKNKLKQVTLKCGCIRSGRTRGKRNGIRYVYVKRCDYHRRQIEAFHPMLGSFMAEVVCGIMDANKEFAKRFSATMKQPGSTMGK